MIHCFQSCFSLNFEAQKRETQYEMFFLENNSLLTWLGNNYTDPLLEAGVFATLRTIHSRRDFYFNFCCYGSTCLDSFFSFFSFFYYYHFYFESIVQTSSKLNQKARRRGAMGRGSKQKEQSGCWGSRCKRIKKVIIWIFCDIQQTIPTLKAV